MKLVLLLFHHYRFLYFLFKCSLELKKKNFDQEYGVIAILIPLSILSLTQLHGRRNFNCDIGMLR
jgi:hypothetical protein